MQGIRQDLHSGCTDQKSLFEQLDKDYDADLMMVQSYQGLQAKLFQIE
jgi:hypothetical protein